jgi:cytochrome P450
MADGLELWLVTGHPEAKVVLSDRRFSADRRHPNFPGGIQGRQVVAQTRPLMITLDGEEHARARRSVIGEYTTRSIGVLRPYIQRIVDRFVDAILRHGGPVDLVQALALPVPTLVICEHLGIPYDDHPMFERMSIRLLQRDTTDQERVALVGELRAYLDRLVTAKERAPGDDFLGRQILKHRAKGAEPDHEDLVGLAFLILLAGHDTTANMISLGVLALLQNPDVRADIAADPSRTPRAVEELLRYFTIVETVTARVAKEDVRVGDVLIRATGSSSRATRPTATSGCSPIPTGWTSPGTPTSTWPSATGRTAASARTWPGWSWRSSTTRSSARSRGSGSPFPSTASPSNTTPTSTASTSCP